MRGAAVLLALAAPAAAQDLDCAAADTMVAITACADIAYRSADDELNAVWAEAMGRARALDGAGRVSAEANAVLLRDAQRAWIAFRDAACSAEAGTYGGGTGASLAFLECARALTVRRTGDLRAYAGEG
ncbi:MAG: lysozyme inhibitor LprI family protein [Hasllibacter sp.]